MAGPGVDHKDDGYVFFQVSTGVSLRAMLTWRNWRQNIICIKALSLRQLDLIVHNTPHAKRNLGSGADLSSRSSNSSDRGGGISRIGRAVLCTGCHSPFVTKRGLHLFFHFVALSVLSVVRFWKDHSKGQPKQESKLKLGALKTLHWWMLASRK